jgi:hypothetical protein
MVELYLHSPIFLGFMPLCLIKHRDFFLTFQGKYLDSKGKKAGYQEY